VPRDGRSWLTSGLRATAALEAMALIDAPPDPGYVFPGHVLDLRALAFALTNQAHSLASACRACGVILDDPSRQCCDECLPTYQTEAMARFSAGGRAKLRELRAAGTDPSHGGEAAKKRGAKTSQRKREFTAWEAQHGNVDVDKSIFTTEILPKLQRVSLGPLAKATGLSVQYCGLVRCGLQIPHPRHWSAFERLTDDSQDQTAT
jgi:hypothetical protein